MRPGVGHLDSTRRLFFLWSKGRELDILRVSQGRISPKFRGSIKFGTFQDQRNNLATVSAYFDVWWNDEYLVWNASEFEGIDRIFVPVKWIFKPEFYMYHRFDYSDNVKNAFLSVVGRVPDFPSDASAEIRSDGKVRMFVSISSKSFCPINFKRFPFDSQTCSFMVSGQNCPVLVLNYEQDDLNDFFLFYTCYK